MVTEKQVEAIKYLILHSKKVSGFAKKICLLLLERSELLTKPISISIIELENGYLRSHAEKMYNGIHDMCSPNEDTHLNALMLAAGSDFSFSTHSGSYDGKGKLVELSGKTSYTAWLSPTRYDTNAEKIDTELETVRNIALVTKLYEKSTLPS